MELDMTFLARLRKVYPEIWAKVVGFPLQALEKNEDMSGLLGNREDNDEGEGEWNGEDLQADDRWEP